MNDTSSSLIQLRKLIQSLQKQESEQIQQLHGDALKQIVAIARENDLSIDHIKIAISARQPKADRTIRVPRKNKRHKTDGTHDSVSVDASVQ
jgi:deoxyribodipyrimidine photolyase